MSVFAEAPVQLWDTVFVDLESSDAESDGKTRPTECMSCTDMDAQEFDIWERERRGFCDLLWETEHTWLPRDLQVVERKLAWLGIESSRDLQRAMAEPTSTLNEELKRVSMAPFKKKTLAALQRSVMVCVDSASQLGSATLPTDERDETSSRESRSDERNLCDVIWKTRPTWSTNDFVAAHRKLADVGICSLSDLEKSLGDLNRQLRESGHKTFSSETLEAWRLHIDQSHGRLDIDASLNHPVCQAQSGLGSMLWQLRGSLGWTTSDVIAVERKLNYIGICDIDSFTVALGQDINVDLRVAGFKTFSGRALAEMRQHLGVPVVEKFNANRALQQTR
uniref:Uncharacterized protein n=1 Tax=Noctiluca scintillans TaxID=2966 RepID=A0A7S1FGE5_NOCSC|mmetsp:Transcript_58866/g.156726  ORF Transcript_58866/g.156726 Transcript_58866/m.156726 type:complete len:336 (+) Transcript_58866:202-1209(+)